MFSLFLLSSKYSGKRGTSTTVITPQLSESTQNFILWAGCAFIFREARPNESLDVTIFNTNSTSTRFVETRASFFVCGASLSLKTRTRTLKTVIWHIPQSFCPSPVFELSSDGRLSGLISELVPLCIVTYPFCHRYQLSAFLQESHLTMEFFVDNFDHPFSSCEPGIQCFFWHTEPFLLKISGHEDVHDSLRLNFEGDSFGHTNNPCYLGVIPKEGEPTMKGPNAEYKCEDKQEFEHRGFRLIVGVTVLFLSVILILHCIGVTDLRIIFGYEEESSRFEKMKAKLPTKKENEDLIIE
jgi:hypothetical protein